MSNFSLPKTWAPGAGIFQDSETVYNWTTGEWERREPVDEEIDDLSPDLDLEETDDDV